jgi:hypothetical protein
LESGFSKELRAALILVEKPENFEGYVTIIRRVVLDLERGYSKGYWDTSSYDTRIEWETTPEVRIASASGTHVKRVLKDVIKAYKEKGLCLCYGNTSYWIRNYMYLVLVRLEADSRSRTAKISTSRVC